nr:MAG TPA: hypothetical protein [Caudoviricetes sp.]
MAGPSNIRVNPFTGTGGATNYVELTEKHIIPAVSPYVIRLSEVPEKQDPSNMKMVYVDSATGAATENTLTEVAATPGQGEFRPDYSTNALEDKTWNTGLIEFSASDAGKIVQVTYTGTGTLASVTSNHWPSWYTDRGDGSDGDFVPTENTTISGVKNYKSVFIKSGITVNVTKHVYIKCLGLFINKGTITADNQGSSGGIGAKGRSGFTSGVVGNYGVGVASKSSGGSGGKDGGAGGVNLVLIEKDNPTVAYQGAGGGGGGSTSAEIYISGSGGSGGGDISIVSSSFINEGTITSNGEAGHRPVQGGGGVGGGGGGGRVLIISSEIKDSGTITANGGAGGSSWENTSAPGENGVVCKKNLGVL